MTQPSVPQRAASQPTLSALTQAWTQRFGGAVIDAAGREIPITEHMVQDACRALEQQAIIGLHARPAR